MELRPLEHGAHHPDRVTQHPVGKAVHDGVARGGQREAQQHPQGRRLAGAVRAEESQHAPRLGPEAEAVDSEVRAVPLRQVADLEHPSDHTSRL
jgi:hypothetical protein